MSPWTQQKLIYDFFFKRIKYIIQQFILMYLTYFNIDNEILMLS